MRPPLNAVPMNAVPLSARELLQEAADWAEYSCELLKDDPETPRLIAREMPQLQRVMEKLEAYQARVEKSR